MKSGIYFFLVVTLSLSQTNRYFCVMKYCKLLLLTCFVLFCSCREQQSPHIRIVCTSDVHGNLFPFDFLTGNEVEGSLARVSSYLNELRNEGSVVYLDNGDMLQGSPATYCYNTHAVGKPHVAAEVLNYLRCDAVTVGNNDIEPGGATYQRYMNELKCLSLGGNVVYEGTDEPFIPPYTLIEREGLQIAVLGLTTPVIPYLIPKCQWLELEFEEMERSAQRWMQHLHENATPDLVVGLFHSGYEGGLVTEAFAEHATRRVAEQVPGFDAIFYGHDHRPCVIEVVNVVGDTVVLLNPGRDARMVATLDVTVSKEGGPKFKASLESMDGYTPDPTFMSTFAPHVERIFKYVNRSIGISTHEAAMNDVLAGPSPLVDFIHQMQLDVSNATISFAAPLENDGVLPEGEVTVGDIYRLFPYENSLYVLWLTGREVKNYLELSYDQWLSLPSQPQRGGYADSASGIVYEVHASRPMGSRVEIKSMADGSPFGMDVRYMVVLNSYRALGGGGLLTQGAGITHEALEERIVYTTTADLRFYMINYIQMRKTITPCSLHQWRFL